MGSGLVPVSEFGLLDELADRAWWHYLHGQHDEVLRECDRGIVWAQALGDEATVRYLLFTRGYALEERGCWAEALVCADELMARTVGDLHPFWRAKAIALRALGTRRSAAQHDAIDLVAHAWSLVGKVDGSVYNQVSAAVVVANSLRKVELYEQSDAQLARLRHLVPPAMAMTVVDDAIQTLAEWATRLRVVGRRRESARVFAMLASRACLLRRMALEAGDDEHLPLVRAAESFAWIGLTDEPPGSAALAGMRCTERLLVGRVGWPMACCGYAYALILGGQLDAADEQLTAMRHEASLHDWETWVAAADSLQLLVTVARHGEHPALEVAGRMYLRATRQLWRERQGRFAAVLRRMRIHELTTQSARAAELNMTDALTGIGNRRAIDVRLAGALVATSGLFIDVDDFKAVNERTSHVVGDEVLVRIAQLVAGCVRSGDLVARFGGDEFVVVLDRASRHAWVDPQLELLAGRIVETVRSEDWASIAPGLRVTVSVGIATVRDPSDLLKALSTSVGRAKRSGRDRSDVLSRDLAEVR